MMLFRHIVDVICQTAAAMLHRQRRVFAKSIDCKREKPNFPITKTFAKLVGLSCCVFAFGNFSIVNKF
jgi:hypothetical protein